MIDLAVAQRNIDRMGDYARTHGLALRPHAKTHKSLAVARLQMRAGAAGLAVAKVGEAELMAEAADDVLIAYSAWDRWRAPRIARLAKTHTLRVAVDSPQAVEALGEAARRESSTIGLLVELDVGHHRAGVGSPEDSLRIAQHADRTAGVRLDGMMFFPGHVQVPPDRQAEALRAIGEFLAATNELWARGGLEAGIVSGGSTPTAMQSHHVGGLTEIRPGTYVYYDRNSLATGCCREEDIAARVLCTVVSNAAAGKVVVDAGGKSLSSDLLAGGGVKDGFGLVVGLPDARVVRLSEEHGEIDVSRCPRPPGLGERIWIIPNHICPVVNLQELAWCTTDGRTVEPLAIEARGKVW